jgi:hypothetical protein
VNKNVGVKELRDSIPAYCFTPSTFWSFFYLSRDLAYSTVLILALRHTQALISEGPYRHLYYTLVISYGLLQGLVWTGLWVIAHECGHSAFSSNSIVNDTIGTGTFCRTSLVHQRLFSSKACLLGGIVISIPGARCSEHQKRLLSSCPMLAAY